MPPRCAHDPTVTVPTRGSPIRVPRRRDPHVRPHAQRTHPPRDGERHDRAELALLVGLADDGYVDAFRTRHGYGRRDRSWLYPNGKTGYRLDHVIVRDLDVVARDYEHAWRDARLSDHAAMWVDPGSHRPA